MQMDWNGCSGFTGRCGLLDGADSMQLIHESLFLCMSAWMPSQKNELCSFSIIDVTPWCPMCKLFKTSCLNNLGVTTRSPKNSRSFHSLRCNRAFQNSRAAVGSSDLIVGKVVQTHWISICSVLSLVVSCCSCCVDIYAVFHSVSMFTPVGLWENASGPTLRFPARYQTSQMS